MAVDSLPSQLHRMSPDEYHQLIEAGVFDEDARIEFIDGFLVDMSPKSREHEDAIAWLNRLFVAATDGDRFDVRISAPLTIGNSEPEPDVTVVDRSTARPYHPGSAALVIEIAVSSQVRDLTEKPPIYAGAGVPDYWVVDLDAPRVVVHTDPRAGSYASVEVVGADGTLRATALELPPIVVADLFAAADR